jgi:lipopolysaccharide export system permease protein
LKARLVIRYVLSEMVPTFILGVAVFVMILLMFQALRLTEFVIVHGVKLSVVAQMAGYMSISFLPILLPMSLVFTIILTYGRLSADSEITAFKSVGLNMWYIMTPALILSLIVGFVSIQTSFHIAPWGNRQFEILISKLGSSKPAVTIKEGTFSEGFFDLVVYTNKVDSKTGKLSQVFIFDERNPAAPVTVIAQEGRLSLDAETPGHRASLQFKDGSLHLAPEGRHTKIKFATYEVFLSDPIKESDGSKSTQSMTIDELSRKLDEKKISKAERIDFLTEFHKRIAIAFACLVFGVIGVGLGTVTNQRSARSGGTVIAVGTIVSYWILYVISESLAKGGNLPPGIAMWLANIVFLIIGTWSLRRVWD